MNTTISNPKAHFLLGAGLDVLYFESREWLEAIAFWKDEIKFFDILLQKKEASDKNDIEFERMLEDLDKVQADLFNELEADIIDHEKLLSRIDLNEKGISDNEYRKKHSKINTRMNIFKEEFQTFKKVVFKYARSL